VFTLGRWCLCYICDYIRLDQISLRRSEICVFRSRDLVAVSFFRTSFPDRHQRTVFLQSLVSARVSTLFFSVSKEVVHLSVVFQFAQFGMFWSESINLQDFLLFFSSTEVLFSDIFLQSLTCLYALTV
jgi:hypothetical protein